MKKDKPTGVLYRKYRPQKFADVVGEDHVVKVLEGAIKLGNISHAYLFSGSRGTGKTSVARILAHEIGTSQNDLYEMDAASTNGVDDIRELNESVHTLPYESKYKVYIIDEAHMLSKSAWNAFLKTLEEPPAHVIFILATTELEKVPETVISRCQTFVFKQPNQSILKDFAQTIAKKEGITLETDAAELVALLGDGSFRDAHGILEKIISSTKNKKINRKEVEAVTGAPKAELVRGILESIVKKDLNLGLSAIHSASEANADMKIFTRLILERLRLLFLIRLKAGMNEYIKNEISEDDFKILENLVGEATADLTSDVLLRFITAYEDAGRTSIPELALELALADSMK
ncbi:MAG: DNA polymerase III subunit gamma/tau [Minisyncoccota bacterium]